MKKLLGLALCASVAIGMSSCTKTENVFCYECTHPTDCDVDICNETVTAQNGVVCNFVVGSSGSTNAEYKNAYQAEGYTCRIN